MAEKASTGRPARIPRPGSKCGFKTYHRAIVDGMPKTEEVAEPFGPKSNRVGDEEYALVIHRAFEEGNCKTKLIINSPHIIEALKNAIRPHNPAACDFTPPLTLQSPFAIIVHYWDELESATKERRQAQPDSEYCKHLDLLFKFMEHEVKPDRDHALALIRNGQIDFKNAWMIYRSGDILYQEFMGEPWLLVCKKTVYEVDRTDGAYLEVHAVYTDDDGETVGNASIVSRVWQRQKFPEEGPVAITELPIYPRRFFPVGDSLERRLKERGEKFLQLKDGSTVKYSGTARWLKKPPNEYYNMSDEKYIGVWLPYMEAGRVVLDRKTFSEEESMSHVKITRATPKPWLCPPFTTGYSLNRKEWVHILVDKISDAGWVPNTWDALVLDKKHKSLLQSLVASHKYPENPRDQTKLKGQGLVILLHGTPGSGKTLTAEVAAEASRKALVSASLGELNSSPDAVFATKFFERELRKVLQYATTWRAIVLLDEADIFLEARGENSAARNALVAVFLKELEYFGGIVFLTTNRVNTFDKAMKSRINLTLEYSHPDTNIRRQIWRRCLQRASKGQSAVNSEETLNKLAVAELNGREIANAVNTASTVARFENRPLSMSHLEIFLGDRQP